MNGFRGTFLANQIKRVFGFQLLPWYYWQIPVVVAIFIIYRQEKRLGRLSTFIGLHKKFYGQKMKNQEMNTDIKDAETEYI